MKNSAREREILYDLKLFSTGQSAAVEFDLGTAQWAALAALQVPQRSKCLINLIDKVAIVEVDAVRDRRCFLQTVQHPKYRLKIWISGQKPEGSQCPIRLCDVVTFEGHGANGAADRELAGDMNYVRPPINWNIVMNLIEVAQMLKQRVASDSRKSVTRHGKPCEKRSVRDEAARNEFREEAHALRFARLPLR